MIKILVFGSVDYFYCYLNNHIYYLLLFILFSKVKLRLFIDYY